MKLLGYLRYYFEGELWVPLPDPNSTRDIPLLTYQKNIMFNFMDDPDAPRQVIVADEPLPTTVQIMMVKDRNGNEPIPEAIWVVTSIEPVISVFNRREVYRHQAALMGTPNFGYDIVRSS